MSKKVVPLPPISLVEKRNFVVYNSFFMVEKYTFMVSINKIEAHASSWCVFFFD